MSLQSQFAFLPISRSLCNIARCKTNQTLSLVDIPKKKSHHGHHARDKRKPWRWLPEDVSWHDSQVNREESENAAPVRPRFFCFAAGSPICFCYQGCPSFQGFQLWVPKHFWGILLEKTLHGMRASPNQSAQACFSANSYNSLGNRFYLHILPYRTTNCVTDWLWQESKANTCP